MSQTEWSARAVTTTILAKSDTRAKSTGSSIFEVLATESALMSGFERVFANRGGPGGDGETVFEMRDRLGQALSELAASLRSGLYRPGAHRAVDIPKKSGGTRRLSIPCVRDRVVQAALHELLRPAAEAEFERHSYAYRPGLGVRQAVAAVERFRDQGFGHVIDADIQGFFDNVEHAKLVGVLARHGIEERVLALVRLWLAAGDAEGDGRGLPQGSPISPLLANLFLDDLDEEFSGQGMRCVRFADDFLVLCKTRKRAEDALDELSGFLKRKGLVLNPLKTRIVSFGEGFRYLGYLFVRSLAMRAQEDEAPARDDDDEAPGAAATATVPVRGEPVLPPSAPVVLPVLAPPLVPEAGPDARAMLRGDGPEADFVPPRLLLSQRRTGKSPRIRPLYVWSAGSVLGERSGAFSVRRGGAEVVAASPAFVDRIEIGPDASIDDEAIRLALDRGTPVVFATHAGTPRGHVGRLIERHGRRQLRQAAAVLDPARSLGIARALVAGKLHNQRAQLYRLNRRRRDDAVGDAAFRIGRIARKTTIAGSVEVLRGIEGEAAALYWPALGRCLEHGFVLELRERRQKRNPVSLVLDFLSSLLTREMDVFVRRAGLHPGFGILHAPGDLDSPVSYDLVEAFRAPLAEALTVYLFNNRILGEADFGPAGPDGVAIFPTGRDRLIRTWEAWLAREVREPRSGEDVLWRGLLAAEVDAFAASVEASAPFQPYRMDY